MSEAKILAAFWNQLQGRFCELTGDEVLQRSGTAANMRDFQSLLARDIIQAYRKNKVTHGMALYSLSPEGERRVSAMVVMGVLPKRQPRLTANPKEAAK